MSDPIPEISKNWADAISTQVPEKVMELYHSDGLLWGTLSPVVRHGFHPIHEYFVNFLKREGLHCEFTENIVREHGDFIFHSGTYVFSWKAGENSIHLPARFSFVHKKENGRWWIMEHHSSLFPDLPFKVRKYIRK
jgi:uncharacterized protein (TIGR02246 family)